MQRQQKEKTVNYDRMLSECENNSRTYDNLVQKVGQANQQIINKFRVKKFEQYCPRKFDSKKKQLMGSICLQTTRKLQEIFERETTNLLNQLNMNEKLKIVDYVYQRTLVMKNIDENPNDWYDEEEHYLDDLHNFLLDYYKKL